MKKGAMLKLKKIFELNNTMCEAYEFLKESSGSPKEIIEMMKYGMDRMDHYYFDLISTKLNNQIKTENNKLKQSFRDLESDGDLDSFLEDFLHWEEVFQQIIFYKIIRIVLDDGELRKKYEEMLEDLLDLMVNCSIHISDDFTALELFSYSSFLARKKPMESYQMGIKSFETFPELGKSFFGNNQDSYGFHYVYQPPEEYYFEECPGCGGKGSPYYTVYPFFASNFDKTFSPVKLWMKCPDCGQLYTYNFPKSFVFPQPEEEELGCESFMSPRPMYLHIFCSILKKAESFSNGGKKLLEVGPGTGELIAAALEMKFDVEAIEISKRQANRLQNLFDMDIHCMDFMDFETSTKYDIITMGDVIEHVTKPRKALEKANLLLNDSGVLWIASPNFESGFSRIFKDKDPMWKEPYHISYFSYDVLKKMLEETGFEVIDYEVSQRYNGSMELFAKKVY